jgi:hypothetical protein
MKTTSSAVIRNLILFFLVLGAFQGATQAQQTTAPTMLDTSKITYNQISQANKLYVFPSKGQSQDQQKKDEYACYNWAIEQTAIDLGQLELYGRKWQDCQKPNFLQ